MAPRDVAMDNLGGELISGAATAVWDTIWLVAQLPGMTQSFEWLLEYGEMVTGGVPSRAAAVLLLQVIEESGWVSRWSRNLSE